MICLLHIYNMPMIMAQLNLKSKKYNYKSTNLNFKWNIKVFELKKIDNFYLPTLQVVNNSKLWHLDKKCLEILFYNQLIILV